MDFDILTTFPEMIEAVAGLSILGRARQRGLIRVEAVNLRDFTHDRHRSTDDTPFGGGPGMVMKPEPVFDAVESLLSRKPGKVRIILLTPQGRRFDQGMAEQLACESHLIMICGRYEGIDERIREHLVTDEISIGDYVLTGGELAALAVVDAVARLLPGVLGDESSVHSESFSSGLLEYPQYTRPAEYRGYQVPEVLLSGNHEEIRKWRRLQSLERTLNKRPDLLESAPLTEEDRRIIKRIKEQ
ncbi:MAG: tRNA (guanosine(37)-N1)-methyltransferase TrmD [Armatimonadetes bacterium]|jgi:tRNA (guanine37-N1)-methyltransferase|nr:tRNA (guanosine(37)-N1)-methyltransferase TrmD [Armatimonadota bacterium]